MRVLIFGKTGQVAMELSRALPQARLVGRDEADLADQQTCAALIRTCDADVIINAAAYTAVDQAETDAETAHLVNASTPGAMAREAATRGIAFLHLSTDYVFDGSGTRPWREDDATGPLGVYGRTKLAGEREITSAGGRHAILRTAWVFSAHGKNFVKTMLRLGETRDRLNVVSDQVGSPTSAAAVARALAKVAQAFDDGHGQTGIFHFAGTPTASWADFAEAILAAATLPTCPVVMRIPSSAYPTPARRPMNSRLDCSKIQDVYGIEQPDWRADLAAVLKELQST